MSHCTKCSHPLKVGERFCTRCGATVRANVTVASPSQVQIPTGVTCPKCGNVMLAGKHFCTHCGANVIRVGRARDNDVVLDYSMIADHHARITMLGDAAIIEAIETANQVAINSPDKKIVSSRLSRSDTVYFGSFPVPAARLLAG